MRRTIIIAGTLLCCLATLETVPAQQPDPTPPPPPPGLPSVRPVEYAANVLYTIHLIEEGYVRNVSRADLLAAALRGLYAAAGESPPNSVHEDIQKAKKDDEVQALLERTRRRPEIAKRLSDGEAFLASCRAMCAALDPHCEIYQDDGITCKLPAGRLDNNGSGIDLEDNGGLGPVRIKVVHPGGPAQKAGLRPGDRITAIDGKPLKKETAADALRLLNGGSMNTFGTHWGGATQELLPGGKVCMEYERDGESKSRQITLDVKEFHTETVYGVQRCDDNSWSYWIDPQRKIAQVRIGPIMKDSANELRAVLSSLHKAGMRALVLDLRWCPGGLLTEARGIAVLFVGEGRIYSIKARTVWEDAEIENHQAGGYGDLPLILLVNDQTSGGAELIAAALQDHKRAAICGQRTRGKASIQTMRALPMNSAYLKLTNAIFIRPNGKNLNRFPDSSPKDDWGVRPDAGLELRVSAKLNQQLREWWLLQTLRPGLSCERLPLDDPSADPQRQFALEALRERIK
jgi:carboxyl-terminal processing protease